MAKTVFSDQQIADQLTRGGTYWYGDNGDNIVHYSFSTSLGSWWSNDSEYGLDADQKLWVNIALDVLESYFDISFQMVSQPLNTSGNAPYDIIQFVNDTNTGTYSSSYTYTGGSAYNGIAFNAIVLDATWSSNSGANLDYGSYGFMTILHEVLHSLGLDHPGDYNAGSGGGPITYLGNAEFAQDTHRFTVMSYFSADEDGSGAVFYDTVEDQWVYPRTPMVYDILAMTSGSFAGNFAGYGANSTTNSSDTVYGYNVTPGAGDVYDFAAHGAPVLTIYDTGGVDTLDLSGDVVEEQAVIAYVGGAGAPYLSIVARTETLIDLREGHYSSTHGMTYNIAIAYGTVIENAVGTKFNDTIIGNDADNVLVGGDGDDVLVGGGGADALDGGNGNDYIYYDAGDSWGDVLGGAGTDTIVFVDMTLPVGLDFVAQSFELIELIVHDEAGAYAWASYTTVYDLSYNILSEEVINDDGSWSVANYDVYNAQTWAEWHRNFNANGALTSEVYVYDDGHSEEFIYAVLPVYNLIEGNDGKNKISGTSEADEIYGFGGKDGIHGNDGDDLIYGGSGNDRIYGDGGDDILYGGLGKDKVYGGTGSDTFVLEANSGRDTIIDFEYGVDRFSLEGSGYAFDDLIITTTRKGTVIKTADGAINVLVKATGFQLDASDFVDLPTVAAIASSSIVTDDYILG